MSLELDEIAKSLIELIHQAVPKATTRQKYGGTLFTLKPDEKERQFCGVFAYKTHIQLSFSEGVHLDDTEKLLQGSGKGRRHINFKSAEQIKKQTLKKMIKQAAKLSVTHVN